MNRVGNLFIALFICSHVFGQEIRFDFSDIKTINSENQAKRFCFRNGFKFILENEYEYYYAFGHQETTAEGGIAKEWFILSKPGDGRYKDDWQISINHWTDGRSDPTFENIVNQVKSECTFFNFINYFGDEYICYSCPKSTYSGKIGFFLGDKADYIMHFNPKWFATIHGKLVSQEVKIGSQVWMTNNLNVDKFRNGDPIPQAKTLQEWEKALEKRQPVWCYYKYDPVNGSIYGKLYNVYAVNDLRGLAPAGFHIPTDKEWETLTNYLGNYDGEKMKSTSGWRCFFESSNCNGSNSSGFSALPGGCLDLTVHSPPYQESIYDVYPFRSIGDSGFWWSSESYGIWLTGSAYSGIYPNYKTHGMSVRCLRD